MGYEVVPIQFVLAVAAQAEPVSTTLEWRPTCDGANIEIVTEGSKILSLRAYAAHSAKIVEWHVLYIDGVPVTAEFRESTRGRIKEGDKAGEYSGDNSLKTIATYRAEKGQFRIGNKEIQDELSEILTKAEAHQKRPH